MPRNTRTSVHIKAACCQIVEGSSFDVYFPKQRDVGNKEFFNLVDCQCIHHPAQPAHL